MARRSQCSSAGDNPLDPNYLPPHYREEYRMAIDALVEEDLEGYYRFLQKADVVDFLSTPEIQHIQSSVQSPQQSSQPEHSFREIGGDGSSDTYWPLHTDLDVPGLDLGWPQMHHFIGPTEVTTLVNPPEPNMPSIKEQARRLIKNAQQVIAIVMDTFTDVDIFADILNAAMRNVAVYIILDEQNATHFYDMVSNCRVNLQNLQFLRVRTVPGITYQCRSGKTFKGQLMDRFLLTDCRAVLSGNYSFMWSFEKLHRCMAHLFLGQLVMTFDEEFRILFAQSQPVLIENLVGQVEDLAPSQKRQYPSDRISLYRESKTFLDSGHSDEWGRSSYDNRIEEDWRKSPLKRLEAPCGPVDMYTRFSSQKPRMEQTFEPGPSRIPMIDNPLFKRHSFAEGAQERLPYHFLQQQGLPDSETHGRHFYRGQQSYPGPEQEADYSVADKFWNQDYLSTDQYSEPQQMEPPDSFDPVLNYLTSARALELDQSSEKQYGRDLGYLHNRQSNLGQRYSCQTSPTPSNPSEQKQFFLEPNTARKDPSVKRGLRNWRISSYLSAHDNPEDDGQAMAAPPGSDPFEEPSYPVPDITAGGQLSVPKIPNVREFKVPAIPRVSQMPSYAKAITQERSKNVPDEPAPVPGDTKTTPTPSESSATTESEKTDEAEQKEHRTPALRRDDSFRRNYNAAQPRASRLRSSLIFHSLDQQTNTQDAKTTGSDQQVEESDKGEDEQPKLPFYSQVLGQRRSTREPFEWSRYLKSSTFDNSSTDSSKTETKDDKEADKDNKDPSKDENAKELSEKPKEQDSLKLPELGEGSISPSVPQSKQPEAEQSNTQIQPRPSLPPPFELDMSDADNRLKFFKELAAQRRAKKADEAKNSKEKPLATSQSDPQGNTPQKNETVLKESTKKQAATFDGLIEKQATTDECDKTVSSETQKPFNPTLETKEKLAKQISIDKNDSLVAQGGNSNLTEVSAKLKISELESAEVVPITEVSQSPSSDNLVSLTAAQQSKRFPSLTSTVSTSTHPPSPDPPVGAGKSVVPSSVTEPEPLNKNLNSKHFETIQDELVCSPALKSETGTNSACESSKVSPQSPTLDSLSDSQSNSNQPPNSNTLPCVDKTKPCDLFSSSAQSAEKTSLAISPEKSGVSESNTSEVQPTSDMGAQQAPATTSAAQNTSVDSVKQEEGISNLEKAVVLETVCDLVKGGNELEKSAVPSVTVSAVVSETVTDSAKELAESKESADDTEKAENVSEQSLNSQKCDSDNESVVLNLDKDALISGTTLPVSINPSHDDTQLDECTSAQGPLKQVTPPTASNATLCHTIGSIETLSFPSPDSSKVSENISLITESDIPDVTCDLKPNIASPQSPTKTITTQVTFSRIESQKDNEQSDSVEGVTKPEKDALIFEKTETGCNPAKISVLSEDVSESEKDASVGEQVDSDLGKKVSGSEKEISKQRQDFNWESPTCWDPDANETSDTFCTNLPVPNSYLHIVEISDADLAEHIPPVLSSAEMTSSLITGIPPKGPQSDTTPQPQDQEREMTPPPNLPTVVSNQQSSGETESCLSLFSESARSVLPPEAKIAEIATSPVHSVPDTKSLSSNANNLSQPTSTNSPSIQPEPNFNVPVEKPNSQQTVVTENGKLHETEKENAPNKDREKPLDGVPEDSGQTTDSTNQNHSSEQTDITSRHSKPSQSRYHSSTANVLSSSNLRDDTKLLLGQISANSQSRSESNKDSPVTDDEKEDEADKNAQKEKYKSIKTLNRGEPKSTQERDKVLERIQCMRKERKVYSRFEV